MKVLVTGGAGYIGSICVEGLLQRGDEVIVFDNLSEGHRNSIDHQATFIQGNLLDAGSISLAINTSRPDAVMHFAANALVAESMQNPKILRWFDQIHGLTFVALRYFNVADASEKFGEHHRVETHLIPRVLQVALGRLPHAEIYGTDFPTPDGTCIRDYIHVLDLASAHILALSTQQSDFFNLGTGGGTSVREVIDACRKITGHPVPAVEKPRRQGDPSRLVASSEKAKEKLGWKPQFENIEVIVESAWRCHRANPDGYSD